jgi:cation diffusion facilitator family transporter
MSAHESTGQIVQSLAVNFTIAVGKGIVAVVTGSGSMLAETLHSLADCVNQVLLLVGVRRAARPPDATHPLGYGRAVYFWSFLVALLLFSGGGMFSIHEGIHKLEEPEPVTNLGWAVGLITFSLLLETGTVLSNVRELNRRRGAKGFVRYLQDTKDVDLVVLFGENFADVVGLLIALAALLASATTGDPRFDAFGSLAIGGVLVVTATFVAREVSSLLLGEAADEEIEAHVRAIAHEQADVETVFQVIAVQQGPGEVLVAIKLGFAPQLDTASVCDTINRFEAELRRRCPEAKWVFVEPDLEPARNPAPS